MRDLSFERGALPRRRVTAWLGRGATTHVGTAVAGAARALVVTDVGVAATRWPGVVQEEIRRCGVEITLSVLDGGEADKTMAAVQQLWRHWLEAGASRDAVVVAVGGGVVTDVAGFAAATFLRGVPWVAVPTTVVGMADAAFGGKTGVNFPPGKNLAGAMHHARAVWLDPDVLATLPDAAYRQGWAEVLKAAVIGDVELFRLLVARAGDLEARDVGAIEEALARAVAVKVAVVVADELETGRREILNFGHTVGHALERATDHAWSHGEAVAVGMVVEARHGEDLGVLPAGTADEIASACRALGLPASAPRGLDVDALTRSLAVDKKRRGGLLRLALPKALGAHGEEPSVTVDPGALLERLR